MDPGEIKPAAGAGSTEERCPICLEDFQDKAFVNACFHILIMHLNFVLLVQSVTWVRSVLGKFVTAIEMYPDIPENVDHIIMQSYCTGVRSYG